MAIENTNRPDWHPLFRKDIRQVESLEQWRQRWEKATLKEDLLGLLHCGFSLSVETKEDPAERICLYLEVANGYKDVKNLTLGEEEQQHSWHKKCLEPTMRLEIAQKALRMLVDKVFADHRKYHWRNPSWIPTIAHPAILEKVIWFFDTTRFPYLQDSNLPDSHAEKHDDTVLRAFIGDFVSFCWEFKGFSEEEGPVEENERVSDALRSLRPQLLEMMSGTDQLWYLMRHPRVLDKASLGKLREIALRKGRTAGPFDTLEEALVSGRRMAAEILLFQPIYVREVERQKQLIEAERLEEKARQLKYQAGQR